MQLPRDSKTQICQQQSKQHLACTSLQFPAHTEKLFAELPDLRVASGEKLNHNIRTKSKRDGKTIHHHAMSMVTQYSTFSPPFQTTHRKYGVKNQVAPKTPKLEGPELREY